MLSQAIQIAIEAGRLLHDHFGEAPVINQAESHDIKLQLDVDCQRLIEERLQSLFPDHSIIGEEASRGNPGAEYRWIVDPLDGTVNYSYGIPHFSVSLGLQRRTGAGPLAAAFGGYETVLGVIHDPLREEVFTAEKGKGAWLNGQPIHVSDRSLLKEAIVSVGFSKTAETIERGLRLYQAVVRQARKIRTMGSAALDLAYVAAGRMEVYYENVVRLWDIAAGVLIVTEAGGLIELKALTDKPHAFETLATNGKVELKGLIESSR